ncbi:UNKNOWN [Stylonychia lemnae]|uniref:Uncharacterized protein n=1 Tax=Stylonychia lemnae TaxID=5949 RepID=A0A078BCW0_STYLE|nr:UNKNOWN [Stylonychia lemnae]|eukprot:CDW91057.1 UNKNOWN [Stylonychia lemnae]
MSTVPQRILQQRSQVWLIQKSICITSKNSLQQIQGPSSTINDRNKKGYEEVNVKPITQNKPDLQHYNPAKYLKPFEDDRINTIEYNSSITNDDIGNSLSFNRILNKKKAAEELRIKSSIEGIPMAKQIDRNSFMSQRRKDYNGSDQMRMSNNGRQIFEKILQVTKDENDYYNNQKVLTKDQSAATLYKRQIPEYFRVLENPKNQKTLEDSSVDGMVSIISKNQGWITVSPSHLDRKNPVEKQSSLAGESTKTSILTPSWMKIDYSNSPYSDPLKGTIQKNGVRQENYRTFLTEKEQPQKSVFSIGGFRHNVATKEQTEKNQAPTNEPNRFIEWKEDPPKQRYDDARITNKIGSFHDRSNSPAVRY